MDYDRAIGHMDVVYRTLLKMGFHASDVMEAFSATASSDIHHILDWVRGVYTHGASLTS